MVPYFNRTGERYREKLYAADGGTRWLGRSKPQIPYGLEDLARGGESMVLTEGESDALALRLAYPKAIVLGLPGASSWRSEWRVYLEDFRRVYLSFDGDRAGYELLNAVKQDVPHYRAILLPDGADTRDVIQQLGKAAYELLVEEADRAYEQRRASAATTSAVKRRQAVDRAWQERQSA